MHRGMKDLCCNWKKTKRVNKGNLTSRLKTKVQDSFERDEKQQGYRWYQGDNNKKENEKAKSNIVEYN